jgi:hypothetical protein
LSPGLPGSTTHRDFLEGKKYDVMFTGLLLTALVNAIFSSIGYIVVRMAKLDEPSVNEIYFLHMWVACWFVPVFFVGTQIAVSMLARKFYRRLDTVFRLLQTRLFWVSFLLLSTFAFLWLLIFISFISFIIFGIFFLIGQAVSIEDFLLINQPGSTYPVLSIIFLLLLRYYVVDSIARHPVIYFRSFEGEVSTKVFARIVAPVVRNFGVIKGLVHRTQPGSKFLRKVPLVEQGRFIAVPDDSWQQWVMSELKPASLAIVDMGRGSKSLDWELNQAIGILGVDRTVVLLDKDCEKDVDPQIQTFSYGSDRASMKLCRRNLKAYLSKLRKKERLLARPNK